MSKYASKFTEKVMERVRLQMACLGYHLIGADESTALDRIREARRRLAQLEKELVSSHTDRAA
jgi:hypothetical protein